MHAAAKNGKAARALPFLLLFAILLFEACSGPLCTRHLYIFREAPEKSPPAVTALLITDPNLAAALVPQAAPRLNRGLPWAPEQPVHQTDAYRLSLIAVDGQVVYQGQCFDTLVTDACEVRAGARRLSVKAEIFGPWGRRSQREDMRADLKAGTVYFLAVEGQGGPEQPVRVVLEGLTAYTPEFRQRLLAYQKEHTQGRSLD